MKDYCTMFPEGWWAYCCKAHDDAYRAHTGKQEADLQLLKCVSESKDGVLSAPSLLIGLIMFAGVSLFGKKYYNKGK